MGEAKVTFGDLRVGDRYRHVGGHSWWEVTLVERSIAPDSVAVESFYTHNASGSPKVSTTHRRSASVFVLRGEQ